jgi:hypothetical protein
MREHFDVGVLTKYRYIYDIFRDVNAYK